MMYAEMHVCNVMWVDAIKYTIDLLKYIYNLLINYDDLNDLM